MSEGVDDPRDVETTVRPADVLDSLTRNAADPESDEAGGDAETPSSLADLRFVGPATAAALDGEADGREIREKRVSYNDLIDAGVNPGVAARIRREHSLSWSFESTGRDLDRRSAQVRGLGAEERAWVSASSGDWGDADERDRDERQRDAEAAWRAGSAPVPVSAVEGVDAETADRLAEAGVTSVRRLATAAPESVADALRMDPDALRALRAAARERLK